MQKEIRQLCDKASEILPGKQKQIELSLICFLSRGHLLLEDVPGVGKTTLVHILSKLLGRTLQRIQFTNDLLPSDILGTHLYDKNKQDFYFQKGPIFGEFILADELNRASPKTQSALLQGMDEREVSIDGKNYSLDENFLVAATQNPYEQVGTFNLPESQIDRFFMALTMGYPSREDELEMTKVYDIKEKIKEIGLTFDQSAAVRLFELSESVHISGELADYIMDIIDKTRQVNSGMQAASPRATRSLIRAAKMKACFEERDYALPEDVKFVAPAVLAHRVGGWKGVRRGYQQIKEILETLSVF